MTDFNLIGEDERDGVLDAIRRRGAAGQLTPAEVADLTARAEAAQTHAGLDSILHSLPPEPPKPKPAPKPRWTGRKRRLSLPNLRSLPPHIWMLAVPAVFILLMASLRSLWPAPTETSTPPTPSETTSSVPRTTATAAPTASLGAGEVLPSGDILWRVGVSIQPGRYLADGVDVCTWQRVDDVVGEDFDIIELYRKTGPRHIVDILPDDGGFVASEGCGAWRPYEPLPTPLSEVGDGDWLVGEDVEVGIYEAPGVSDNGICVWSRGEDFSREEVLQYNIGDRSTSATLRPGERFSTRGCGTWTKIG